MYFAHDPYAPDLAQQINQAVRATLAEHADSKTYALTDASMLPEWGATLWSVSQADPQGTLQAVYQDTPLHELEECAPFVGLVGPEDLQGLFAHCSGTPFLSLICASMGTTALRQHLARFSRAQTPDGLYHPTRFADTATLPALLRGMTAKQLSTLMQGIDAWLIVGRDGMLQALAMPDHAQKAPPHGDAVGESSYPLSDLAMAQVLDATDADRLLCAMGEDEPHNVQGRPAALLYDMARYVVNTMNTLHIDAEPERISAFRQAMGCHSAEEAKALLQTLAPSHT
jgi:hypothetical protein